MLGKAENKHIFQKQVAFGEGKSVGRMLAHLVRTNSPSMLVPIITTREGRQTTYTPEIVDRFRDYYEELYRNWGRKLITFLGICRSPEDRSANDMPISLEEKQRTV